MISKAKIKFIKSLQVKKYRKQEQCFVVEGAKSVEELLTSDFKCVTLLGTRSFLDKNAHKVSNFEGEIIEVTDAELQAAGDFKTNDGALAIARIKPNTPPTLKPEHFALILDDIRDPGNLGTIIRTADWYNIPYIIASEETADVYNSKVITATMGSFTRVQIFYTDLENFLDNTDRPVYGTFLEGIDIHTCHFQPGFVVVGNESRGVSDAVAQYVTQKITIPRFGKAESLNAAIATAIVLDNILRK